MAGFSPSDFLMSGLVGAAMGVISGVVTYLWDFSDDQVHFYGGILHSKSLWTLIVPVVVLFLWAWGSVGTAWVVASWAGWLSAAVTAWLMDFVWPIISSIGDSFGAVKSAADAIGEK